MLIYRVLAEGTAQSFVNVKQAFYQLSYIPSTCASTVDAAAMGSFQQIWSSWQLIGFGIPQRPE